MGGSNRALTTGVEAQGRELAAATVLEVEGVEVVQEK